MWLSSCWRRALPTAPLGKTALDAMSLPSISGHLCIFNVFSQWWTQLCELWKACTPPTRFCLKLSSMTNRPSRRHQRHPSLQVHPFGCYPPRLRTLFSAALRSPRSCDGWYVEPAVFVEDQFGFPLPRRFVFVPAARRLPQRTRSLMRVT